ncbi:uncharacterized protein LOC131068046 isoform X2 [Cryptomeria japonica]|uniref:uncharacterized protein LOC131068046 isoform X2 n=1 Tax=Cryptomeria japonica TaxID=3369 RepID=UPI0027DA84EF|nr:uncharacterized protein LOC131068046 isoform X2 [Cryptomeria japonica]
MESILAMALESTLKYWLNSFSRDQFKLQGRTVQLSNLDINGDALHASAGLPPALSVTQAKVGKLQIKIPSVSNVQIEPVVVQINRLDLVLAEKLGFEPDTTQCSQLSSSTTKSSGYGFADKIADGMTLQIQTVNVMLETCGGAGCHGGATWTPPLASITIRNLLLYTTNENWQAVNLKEARDFSSNKKNIYVFKKLEWDSLSVDLLPHPDMFSDERLTLGENRRDDDGAKRMFFGGERFLDNISGQAYITIKRTDHNNPLGLEVQLHVPEALCPALSEPGLRALLRFMTGLYVCMNRGDVDPITIQQSSETASHSLVTIIVDNIFLCIKDAEFQLEVLMQSLHFSRASVSEGELTKTMSHVMVGGFFLRDAFLRPPCTLVQPSMEHASTESLPVPIFATKRLWPSIYPLEPQSWQKVDTVPMICLHSLQTNPSPAPPALASQTVVQCQPIKINLQEESFLRIASFLADGIVVNPSDILPDTSVNSFYLSLKEFDITIPVDAAKIDQEIRSIVDNCFTGARLHVESLIFAQSPSGTFRLLNLDKDPACVLLWKGQPIDSSQRKWVIRAAHLSLFLETGNFDDLSLSKNHLDWKSGLWQCVELHEPCMEGAMVTADGSPLVTVPPPGGVVRMAVACKKFISNTSLEQLLFVLKLYAYMGKVGEDISKIGSGDGERTRNQSIEEANGNKGLDKTGSFGGFVEMVPSDTAVTLSVDDVYLKFLESIPAQMEVQGPPLVQFLGTALNIKVSHRTLGGAMVISSVICWQSIQVDCVETELKSSVADRGPNNKILKHHPDGTGSLLQTQENYSKFMQESPQMRPVLWINVPRDNLAIGHSSQNGSAGCLPFLDVSIVHVLPYRAQDAECHSLNVTVKMSGVRLGGGMNYNEALLHRFGILGPDGGPGEGLKNGLKNLSRGPLGKLFKSSPQIKSARTEAYVSEKIDGDQSLELTSPDDIEIDIKLQDWLFALEGAEGGTELSMLQLLKTFSVPREQRCWHMAFQSMCVSAKSSQKSSCNLLSQSEKPGKKPPVEVINVSLEGLKVLKPKNINLNTQLATNTNFVESCSSIPVTHDFSGKSNGLVHNHNWGSETAITSNSGVDLKVRLVISNNDVDFGMGEWIVESVKGAINEPVEVEATKEELEYLLLLSKSEIESLSRITAGVLQILQLQGSLGQAAINQLNNIASGILDKVVTPEKFGRQCSTGTGEGVESTLSVLEQSVSEAQILCATLSRHLVAHPGEDKDFTLSSSRMSAELDIKELKKHLETMQASLFKLRNKVV